MEHILAAIKPGDRMGAISNDTQFRRRRGVIYFTRREEVCERESEHGRVTDSFVSNFRRKKGPENGFCDWQLGP